MLMHHRYRDSAHHGKMDMLTNSSMAFRHLQVERAPVAADTWQERSHARGQA